MLLRFEIQTARRSVPLVEVGLNIPVLGWAFGWVADAAMSRFGSDDDGDGEEAHEFVGAPTPFDEVEDAE